MKGGGDFAERTSKPRLRARTGRAGMMDCTWRASRMIELNCETISWT